MRRAALLTSLLVWSGLVAGPAAGGIGVTGRIELPDGEPAAGVPVELVAQTSSYEYSLLFLEGRHFPEPVARALTSADGRYALEAPEPGMWQLYVAAQGHRPMEYLFLPLLEERIVPDLTLTREIEVAVRLTGAAGDLLGGAHVRANRPPNESPSASPFDDWRPAYRQAITDAQGRAVLGRGPDEALELYAFAPGYLETTRAGVESRSVELRLEGATPRAVRVRDAGGRALAGALARLGERRWPVGVAGEDGLVELPLPAEGEPKIQVYGPDGGRVDDLLDLAGVAADEPLTVTVQPPDRRFGQVVDGQTRRGIAGAFAWIGGRPAEAVRTDADGAFSLSTPAGTTRIWFWGAAEGYLKEMTQLAVDARTAAGSGTASTTVALRRALHVTGVVEDENGEPVADAAVTANINLERRANRSAWQASSALAPAVSDARGRFTVGDLHPEVAYVIRAVKPGFAPAEHELPNPAADPTQNLRLVLELGHAAIGRVVGASGEPVVGARIKLMKSPRSGSIRRFMISRSLGLEPGIEGYTNESGEFAIPDLAPGSVELEASASGYAPSTVPAVEIASDAVETDVGEIVLEPGATIEGRVTDRRGSSIEGAQVFASESQIRGSFVISSRQRDEEPVALSDIEGFFSVPDRRAGEKIDLSVRMPGYAEGRVAGVEAPTSQPIAVRLDRVSKVRGEVVDGSGRAVAGAHVWSSLHISMGMGSMTRSQGNARTDENGLFVIEKVDPGRIQLNVRAEGYQNAVLDSLVVEPEQDLENVRVVLEPGAALSGRITDASGRPVEDVIVMVSDSGILYSNIQETGMSDADGRYRLDGLAPGSHSITARHDRYQVLTRAIEVELGENVVDLAFEGTATISGRVVDEAGSPVPGANVELSSTNRMGWQGQSTLSDTSGEFSIAGVAEGSFTLKAQKEGYAAGFVETLEVGAGDLPGLEIRLATGSTIVGQLVGLEPSEYASVQVMAIRPPQDFAMGRVDLEGGFRIDDLGPGEYHLHAQTGMGVRSTQKTVTVDPGATEVFVELEFESGLTLAGVVLRGGEPLTGAIVTASGRDVVSQSTTTTDSQGRFELHGLKPGRHFLGVSSHERGLNHRQEIDLESSQEVIVRIEAAVVSGFVLDARDSTPLAGASVRLESIGTKSALEGFQVDVPLTTDSAGYFRFADAAAGAHRLVAQKDGYAPAEIGVTVVDGLDQEGLELQLEPTEGLTIFVTLPNGQPVPELFAAVLDATGQTLMSGVYPSGREGTRISAPPGEWELLVAARDTATSSLRVTVPSEPVAIALAEEARVMVRVPELEDQPTLATVRAIGPDGTPFRSLQWRWTRDRWPLAKGRGGIGGLPAGNWLITVEIQDGRSWHGQVTLGPGDNPELVLR